MAEPTNTEIGAGQIEFQAKLNEILNERNKILEKANSSLSQHSQLMAAFTQHVKETKDSATSSAEALNKLNDSLGKTAQESNNAGKGVNAASNRMKEASKSSLGLTGVLKKLWGGMKMVGGAALGMAGFIKDGVGSILKWSKAIVAIPFQMLGGLIEMANSLPSGPNPITVQLEEIRKAFGDLSSNEGKTVANSLKEIRGESKNLAGTGLSVARVFGPGPEGVAAAMKEFAEISTALGPSLNRLQENLHGNIPELVMLTKGFTGSAEATAAMLKHAQSLGKDGTQHIVEMTSMAQKMGKQYGISAKVLGKSVGEMSKDVSNFGSMSVKQMSAAAVYTAKLGLEVQDLGNVMNKFLNFEDAAKGAAEMAQAFGMNVDTMELMKGGPEAIEAMRKSFFAAGKSIDNMTNAERKLLEQQTGLTGASLEAAFAASNQGTSYDEIASSAEDAGSVQEQQIKVFKELAKSIERFVGSAGEGFKSFGDAMSKGFTDGFMRAGPMYQLLRNIRKSMRDVYWVFRDVGKVFVNMFPGFKTFASSLAKLFDPDKLLSHFYQFGLDFRKFMSDLADPKKKDGALKKFFENIQKNFQNFFSSNGDALKGVKEGGKTILSTLGTIFTSLMTVTFGFLKTIFDKIGDAIPDSFSGTGGPLATAFLAAWDSLVSLVDKLWVIVSPVFTKLANNIIEWFKTEFPVFLQKIDPSGIASGILGFLTGPGGIAIAGAAAAGFAPALLSGLMTAFKGVFAKGKEYIGESVKSLFSSKAENNPIDVPKPSEDMQKSGTNWSAGAKNAVGAVVFLGAMLVLVPLMGTYLKFISTYLEGLEVTTIVKAGLVTALLVGMLAGSIAAIAELQKSARFSAGFGALIQAIVATGLVLVAMAGAAWVIFKILGDLDAAKLSNMVDVITKLSVLGAAAFIGASIIGAAMVIGGVFLGPALAAGVAAVGTLLVSIVGALVPAIDEIQKINIPDPVAFNKKIDAITSLAGIGMEGAKAVAAIMDNIPTASFWDSNEEKMEMFNTAMEQVKSIFVLMNEPVKIAREMLDNLVAAMTNIPTEKFDAGIKLLSTLFPPLMEFMSIGTKIFSDISKSATSKDGKIDTNKVRSLVTSFQSLMTAFTSGDLVKSLNSAVNGMIEMITGITVPKDLYKKVGLIRSIFDIIKVFGEVLSNISELGSLGESPTSAASSKNIGPTVSGIVNAMSEITKAIPANMSAVVSGILAILKIPGMESKEIPKKVGVLKTMFESMKAFNDAIGSFKGNADEAAKGKLGSFTPMLQMMTNFFQPGQGYNTTLKYVISGIAQLADFGNKVGLTAAKINLVKAAFEGVASVTSALSGIKAIPPDIGAKLIAINNVFSASGKDVSVVQKLVSGLSGLTGVKVAADNSAGLATVAENAGKFMNSFKDSGALIETAVSQYVAAVEQINSIGDAFAQSHAWDMAIDLRDAISKSQAIKVDTSGATYNITVNVSVDAEKLAEHLVATGKLKETLGLA